ncbi:hypothetical protein [Mycobacterium xenopi]|uniref:hypothetical protein n=1 Tax=Mycobacterium xenopi TaxID=1789 RepID=UPI0011599908|nr:hypothetical protein [Mycobacterium xenopi]MDA3642092.1 hypothetical protein [Mycobacterium xenopi]MDA3659977.1 hypothetical protein [Mycobacterium xenopi]MDA3664551.1 hypothetical protein [Mycobacterium xenopi]
MHPVDALLQSARRLLGTMTPAQLGTINCGPDSMPTPASWSGDSAQQAAAAGAELDQHRDQLKTAYQAASSTTTEANKISREAHTSLRAVETAWDSDKAAAGPYANTAEGQAALLKAGQQRVQEATQVVRTAAERFQNASQRVSAVTATLPNAGKPEESHATPAGFGVGDQTPKDPAGHASKHPLDLAAIQHLPPNQPGPYGYMPIADGVWVPDPSVNQLHPGLVGSTAKYPLDLADLRQLAPGELPRYGEMQLVPGWAVPDPTAPGYSPHTPRIPLDLQDIVKLPADALGPRDYIRLSVLSDGSAIWVPDPNAAHSRS